MRALALALISLLAFPLRDRLAAAAPISYPTAAPSGMEIPAGPRSCDASIVARRACGPEEQEKPEPLKLGSGAPDFALPDVQGKQMRLQDFKGKTVVVNFWAFWCDTWKDELPHLKALTGQQNELGFKLLTISVDGTRLQEFSKQTGNRVPFPVLLDVGGKVSAAYHIAHVPTVLIVDAEGKVRAIHIGYPGNQAILTKVRQIAAEHKRISRRNRGRMGPTPTPLRTTG